MNETPKMIKATGGFAKSEVWRQMMSDIFDTELVVPESYESSCLGACVLGLKAVGDIEDFQSFHRWLGLANNHMPFEENVAVYQELVSIFINLSRSLTENYEQIVDFQRQHMVENKHNKYVT